MSQYVAIHHLDVTICEWTYQEKAGNTFSMTKAQMASGTKHERCMHVESTTVQSVTQESLAKPKH